MDRATPLGAYVPARSCVHALDARVKLGLLVTGTVAAFGASSAAGLAVAAAGLAVALAASRTAPSAVLRGLRPAAVILAFSLLANAVVLVGQPGISWEGLARGVTAVLRIVLVVGLALVFSSTTTPPAIADALASVMSPLRHLGVPVGDLAMVASVALRFIPLTMEEVERIRCAQRARGARLDDGPVSTRLRAWAQVLVPLLVGLFRRADELASAMSDRCYTGEQTAMSEPLGTRDLALLACGLAWAAAAVLV